ncbi:MAG: DEAD/DEAH box helicase [Chthonomonadetes bacterium]|nr:DEAD/DEAH box helicase [Chthonomonadetes bacterium]
MATIFNLHTQALKDYRDFVQSFILIADERAEQFVKQALTEQERLWPEPLVQVSPAYAPGCTVDDLAEEGVIAPTTAEVFRLPDGRPFRLYRHQEEAIRMAQQGQSYVVTSGTGSGKSLCYFLPIVDSLVRNPDTGERVGALVVYPMNALVNSQLQSLETLRERYEMRTGKPFPVTFAKYTGETKDEERDQMRRNPPQILLTNYVMAELLLVRPEDQRFLERVLEGNQTDGGGLRFLVFDELHTYRGRQGADVAMLVRRLKERCASPKLVHVGTSATMISRPNATPYERKQAVATFASQFFGHPLSAEQVIEETLVPLTEGGIPSAEELRRAMDEPLPDRLEAFRRHPLARWVEYQLGIEHTSEGGLRRRSPQELSAVAKRLAEETGLDVQRCEQKLREVLMTGSDIPSEEGTRCFAFKLHQFIAQGRTLYATLQSHAEREFSLDGQVQARTGENEPIRYLYPIRFCRMCGQDYYHVLMDDSRFLPYREDAEPAEEGARQGYLMLAPDEAWQPELPEDWYDTRGRLKRNWRHKAPQPYWVTPDGSFSVMPAPGAQKVWWQPYPFSLCPTCGEYYTEREREFAKLTSLSSEGRSSATTILATSLLRYAREAGGARDKLLTFTDNRQDASLQAGHFNDFVHVALLRAALYAALKENSVLTFDRIAHEVVRASGLSISDIARNPQIDPASKSAQDIWKAFTDLTEYRLYEDLRRSWRVVHPNLEQVGLLRMEYNGLRELVQSEEFVRLHPSLAQLSPDERYQLVRVLLDRFRRKMAIEAKVLVDEQSQQQLRRRCEQHLNDFWGLDPNTNELRLAECYVLLGDSNKPVDGFSLGERSAIGRYIRQRLQIGGEAFRGFMQGLLDLLVRHNLLVKLEPIDDHQRYRLNASCLLWCLGDGTAPPPDLLDTRGRGGAQTVNPFFQRFYQLPPKSLSALEAREHTAQVVQPGERERRERRFRWEDSDAGKVTELGRRLPYLVCSPTMELGIDIADLDLVHLRNVPPTPANYAQRVGRAGRQGQPGLVVTYCGAFNNHDQYFFHHRAEMVAGSVRPPRLDLTSEALLRAHIHAVWLAEVRLPLGKSIEEVIDTEQADLPLTDEAKEAIDLSLERRERVKQRIQRILSADMDALLASGWFRPEWIDRVIAEAPQAFDRAFDRWRELYRAARAQMEQARREQDRARTREDQQRARQKQDEAQRQLNLLLQLGVAREESDFYPYRYLASEGFLPGYNFPSLPVRVWVPRGEEGEFISRPRFLAIREFAPQNILYHEGAQWECFSFQSPPGGLEMRKSKKRFCRTCGGFCDPELDLCPMCHTPFSGTNSTVADVLDMPNVRARRRARITADEEERRRLGYHIQTFFQFAPEGSGYRVQKAQVVKEGTTLLHLTYAPAATLMRVNNGWRGAKAPGFLVDFDSGEVRSEPPDEEQDDHPSRPMERVRLAVQATQNLLLIRPLQEWANDPVIEPSLRQAIKRGIEETFQLEEAEIAAEPIGSGEHQAILLYEVTEGGAGVLRRLVEEPDALALVARTALDICHFDPEGNDLSTECYAACYQCLLSFANQNEALLLNRHRVRDILLDLSRSRTESTYSHRSRDEQYHWLWSLTDERSSLERQFLDALYQGGYRLPDDAQKRISEVDCVADFFYDPNVCVFCDGSVHDEPATAERDKQVRDQLRQLGYRVITIRYDQDLHEQIARYPEVFGPGG